MKPLAGALAFVIFVSRPALSQEAVPGVQASGVTPASSTPSQTIRVFVTDSDSWQTSGGSGGARGTFGGGFSGGASPQTAEIIKTVRQRCPELTVNSHVDASDYVLRLEHEGGKGLLRKKDKVAVFQQRSGDSIYSASTLSVGSSVQGACEAISKDWPTYRVQLAAASQPPAVLAAPATASAPPAVAPMASLAVEASVTGADIEIDGSFVGSTPSTLSVAPGQHTVTVKKKGYADWSRSMTIAGNAVHLNADLTATP